MKPITRQCWVHGVPVILMACAAGAGFAASAPRKSASGTGTIAIHQSGDHGEAPGTFDFSVTREGGTISGRFEFAAEVHDDERVAAYPHVVVRMESIDSVSFRGQRVTFSGTAWMQGEDVFAEVTATNGVTEDDKDHLSITCSDESGVVLEVEGNVTIGSIQFES